MNKPRKSYTATQAAYKLGINYRTLVKRIDDGVIPDRRNPDNGFRIIFKEDIETLRKRLEGDV